MKVSFDGRSEFIDAFKTYDGNLNIKLIITHNENIKSHYVERFNRKINLFLT